MKKRSLKKHESDSVSNSQGQVFYGLHMYEGVAEYRPSRNKTFRLLIKEPAIRKMGPTFPGRPIFVHHNENFSEELDILRTEADGWVTDSFYNEADGRHWAKLILVTDRALNAKDKGYKLSNAYDFKRIDESGGVYNGLDYDFEVLDGEYKHMALVPDPRYDSMLLTPEEFKKYNDTRRAELKRVANSNDNKGNPMKRRTQQKSPKKFSLSLFKRTPVENSKDLAQMSVLLPESKEERTIEELVEIADGVINSEGKPRICNATDVVLTEDEDGNETEMTVEELWDELEELRARVDQIESDVYEDEETSDDADVENEDDDDIENADDEFEEDDEDEKPKKSVKNKPKVKPTKKAKNSIENEERVIFRRSSGGVTNNTKTKKSNLKPEKTKTRTAKNQRDDEYDRRDSRRKAERVRNAADNYDRDDDDSNVIKISTPASQLARGMEKYGKL